MDERINPVMNILHTYLQKEGRANGLREAYMVAVSCNLNGHSNDISERLLKLYKEAEQERLEAFSEYERLYDKSRTV